MIFCNKFIQVIFVTFLITFGMTANSAAKPVEPIQLEYKIIAEYPSSNQYFTQGFIYRNNKFYHSSGLYGRSFVSQYTDFSKADLMTARFSQQFFAEGLTLFQKNIFVLTWKAGVVFVLDAETLAYQKHFTYEGEGWGLTNDQNALIMSDGSSWLTWRRPDDFTEIRKIQVKHNGNPVENLNELEMIEGVIWANIWKRPEIILINPETGDVTAMLDFSKLVQKHQKQGGDVLNGIAYDAQQKAIYITGKFWNKVYQIALPAAFLTEKQP